MLSSKWVWSDIPQSHIGINPSHSKEESENTKNNKISGSQIKQSNLHSFPVRSLWYYNFMFLQNKPNIFVCLFVRFKAQLALFQSWLDDFLFSCVELVLAADKHSDSTSSQSQTRNPLIHSLMFCSPNESLCSTEKPIKRQLKSKV